MINCEVPIFLDKDEIKAINQTAYNRYTPITMTKFWLDLSYNRVTDHLVR